MPQVGNKNPTWGAFRYRISNKLKPENKEKVLQEGMSCAVIFQFPVFTDW